jgi:hypothetical protein
VRTAIIVAVGFTLNAMFVVYQAGLDQGRKAGMKSALNTNPVSEELELVCAGLWIGEQNKQAFIKEKK